MQEVEPVSASTIDLHGESASTFRLLESNRSLDKTSRVSYPFAVHHLDSEIAGYRISTDPDLVNIDVVHDYLSNHSYWAAGRSREIVAVSVEHSALVVGAYTTDGDQVGFARMVSDLATFAWLADVFVLEAHRGRGLGRAIVEMAVEHPDMIDIHRQVLATADAHSLYADVGFVSLEAPSRWMIRPGPEQPT